MSADTIEVVTVDPTTMSSTVPNVDWDDVITLTSAPNLSPGYINSTTIDWNSMHLAGSFDNLRTSNTLDLRGDDADIRINGQSLVETLRGIQDRLEILRPNPELESRWQQLRELREQYQLLEQQLIEKEEAWKALQQHG
jgi:hypothetical protein